ncbi:MAG: biopolymer transporter ExbD [Bdellovibrionaceae bacterium]|nr:biopolymer transporter ExbD [Pseudobdellovibrionaceae bacterium]
MKKDLNFELNILPVLDILSVLICFLLLTAIWMHVGTIDTKQAIGDNAISGEKNPPSLWVTLAKDGSIQLSLRDVPKANSLEESISKISTGINWSVFSSKIQTLKEQMPELRTTVVRPEAQTSYGDVIRVMDQLKKYQFEGVGLSPLG